MCRSEGHVPDSLLDAFGWLLAGFSCVAFRRGLSARVPCDLKQTRRYAQGLIRSSSLSLSFGSDNYMLRLQLLESACTIE